MNAMVAGSTSTCRVRLATTYSTTHITTPGAAHNQRPGLSVHCVLQYLLLDLYNLAQPKRYVTNHTQHLHASRRRGGVAAGARRGCLVE
jgi:hypothetical protein